MSQDDTKKLQKPDYYISQIAFNNGQTETIKQNDIVVFVGPNNVGKSQALKDIYDLTKSTVLPGTVIQNITVNKNRDFDIVDYLEHVATIGTEINLKKYNGFDYHIREDQISRFNNTPNYQELRGLFVGFIKTDNRLSICTPPQQIDQTSPISHPIHQLVRNSDFRKKVADIFQKAFGEPITPNSVFGQHIPLCLGRIPTPQELNGNDAQECFEDYSRILSSYPLLHLQGDGMRSFAGILLYLIIDTYLTYLVDEPEAFLHPPQAAIMGEVIASALTCEQQAFISTHSRHIIKGLLSQAPDRVKIIRITREKNTNSFSVLENQKIFELWNDPLLKHSDIMDGMFYKNVVVCESDADCRFYSIVNSFLKEQQKKFSETLFVHCGGKGRMKKVVQALRSLNIDFRVVPDIDLLNNKQALIDLVEACGGTWDKDVDYNTLVDGLEKVKNSTGNEILEQIKNELGKDLTQPLSRTKIEKLQNILIVKTNWDQIKKFGIAGAPQGQATQALQNLVDWLKEFNIHLVPCGELECFIKTIGGHGPDWLNNVLENYPDTGADEYIAARNFVASWNL